MKETLTTIEKALFLKELEFFGHVPIEQAAAVAATAQEVHFDPGTVIYQQTDPAEFIFLVLEGRVVAEQDGIISTVFGPGNGFGDLSLNAGATYAHTARVVDHTHALRFSIAEFVDTMLEHPEIAVGVVRALAIRLREAGQQLTDLNRQLQDGSYAFRLPDKL